MQVTHCDLSPKNSLLDCDLNLKIADFGGASLCGEEPSATPATRFRSPVYPTAIGLASARGELRMGAEP
ncbi:uncharacterized protein P174DRAFT_445076 [Aspergillus novofumigatus IBT 16806]|uniref:Protein kinase domain-containing protein n=1 Tax=Aspergillus novofumigatus (strain IBT 16806) TaxID=1392255 RepID=A0A2I1BXG1_ASPN1|nr:uncharacterized protein P174DRAFT_445076 [Aspergillus novofumigatus IBT 16806]PKX90052.1 hypothetical protein P174DRAFT_445076 [Aspergillus novofumigatus IBT 16806]